MLWALGFNLNKNSSRIKGFSRKKIRDGRSFNSNFMCDSKMIMFFLDSIPK